MKSLRERVSDIFPQLAPDHPCVIPKFSPFWDIYNRKKEELRDIGVTVFLDDAKWVVRQLKSAEERAKEEFEKAWEKWHPRIYADCECGASYEEQGICSFTQSNGVTVYKIWCYACETDRFSALPHIIVPELQAEYGCNVIPRPPRKRFSRYRDDMDAFWNSVRNVERR